MSNKNSLDWDHLFKLSDIYGVSGYEYRVARYLEENIKFEMSQDGIGSALFTQKGDGVRIMIATHMDEVGFYIKSISEAGYIYLQPVGNIWTHVLLNQEVVVISREDKEFFGIVGSKATHGISPEERAKTVAIETVYVDMGVTSRQELYDLGIREGDMVAPVSKSKVMNNPNFITGKAFDDRASVFVGLELMNELHEKPSQNEVTLSATVQEEVGLRGARTSADLIFPDLAIAIDTTLAGDTPSDQNSVKLGKGVSISVIDSMTIMHRGVLAYVEDLCERENIEYQLGCFTDGGTDAGNIHKSREGIPSITLSIPMRYMHTHQGVVHKRDIEATYQLVSALVKDLTVEKYERILKDNYNYEN